MPAKSSSSIRRAVGATLVAGTVIAPNPAKLRAANDNVIRPFHVNIPQAELNDLRKRVLATRWPSKETVSDLSQGVPLATMQKLAAYRATDYDWRKCEA